MSFVGEPFRHDVFVSYSHGDVRGDGKALLHQWSKGFVRELELELQAFPDLGSQIKVFLDQSFRPGQGLDPMAPLSDNLKAEVAASAVLLLLMTPQYLASQWCRQEREWWIEAQRELRVSHDGRVAVARVWPTGSEAWPQDLLDRAGHQLVGQLFYDKSKGDIRPQPYSWPDIDSSPGPFRDALLDLVGRIRMRLLALRDELAQREEQRRNQLGLVANSGQVIYLYGRDLHASDWKRVGAELEADGYIICPEEPEPLESDPKRIRQIQAERVRTMSASDAVLVLGTDDARALTADLMVIGRLDRHQAIAQSNRRLPCGVVDTAGVLHRNAKLPQMAKSVGVDWFDASSGPWIAQINPWLTSAGTSS